jgi:NAD(P)-dependent dehydrogenase (short-subunit alcohol dehydrogenase family)
MVAMSRRVCLLTGASGRLGTAFIERFAGSYEIIAVHNRRHRHLSSDDQMIVDPLFPITQLAANQRAFHSFRANLQDAGEIEILIDKVVRNFGRVDLLINGETVRGWSPLLSKSAIDHAEQLFRLNFHAPLRLCVGLANKLWRSDPASNLAFNRNVINISSSVGCFVYPDQGQALDGSSKAALNHLTYHLASEFWDIGIRVNALAPDSFCDRASTDIVLDAIASLDSSNQTGRVLPLCRAP